MFSELKEVADDWPWSGAWWEIEVWFEESAKEEKEETEREEDEEEGNVLHLVCHLELEMGFESVVLVYVF